MQYYCEECGVSCCSDCLNEEKFDYFICQDCESKNIEILEDGTKLCTQCGKENIVRTTQHLKSCPKCNSHQVINIYEKKEELEKKFLDLIKETRSFVKPLRNVNLKLNTLRQRLEKARDPPIRCYHYPNMESELLELFKLDLYVKNNVHEKINIHFRQLSLNKEYFFDIYRQPNSNIKIIEGILENLHRSYDSINEFMTQNVNGINEKIERIDNDLQIIHKIEEIFIKYKSLLNLAENEKPVYAIKTRLSNGLNTQEKFKKNKGILFITNFDLSFVHEYGILKKKQETIFKAPVSDLISVKERGRIFKRMILTFSYGKYEFSLPSNSISKIIEYVLLARNFDENAIYDSFSAMNLQRINLDLQDLISFIEEGINTFFTSKCQYNKDSDYRHNERYRSTPNYNKNGSNQSFNQAHVQDNQWPQIHAHEMPSSHSDDQAGMWRAPYEENTYYSQSVFNPYKVQNYAPQRQNSSYNQPSYNQHSYTQKNHYNHNSSNDDKNFLMKKLEKTQKFRQPMPMQEVPIGINSLFNEKLDPTHNFQPFNKNHISDMFHSNSFDPDNTYYNDDKHQKLMNLKRDHFGLKETIKKLDSKFDQGIISEVDYFKTFRNLQKEIYLIEKNIETLNKEEEESIKRNYNKYFS